LLDLRLARLLLYTQTERRYQMLKFSKGNAKLDGNKKVIYTFSLPAGRTCPGADECKSMTTVTKEGKRRIKDGPNTKFRCFAASQEVLYRNVHAQRQHNLQELKAAKGEGEKVRLILDSLPEMARYVRVHVSGDFYSREYFNAWMRVAELKKGVTFYAYTKSIHHWVKRAISHKMPSNFILTASLGGKHDGLLKYVPFRTAKVVFSQDEADKLGLEIDHDDSLAMSRGPSFALLIHGVQPKGTEAAKAWQKVKTTTGGYNKAKAKKLKLANA
jgi:hypothetical protein